jgi:hypothetical protein
MYKIASGTAVVVLLSMLSQPALALVERSGLGDGSVLVLRDGTRPGEVAKVIRRENLDPRQGGRPRTRFLGLRIDRLIASSPHRDAGGVAGDRAVLGGDPDEAAAVLVRRHGASSTSCPPGSSGERDAPHASAPLTFRPATP